MPPKYGFVDIWFPSIGEERTQKVGAYMKDIEKLVITRGTKEEDKDTVYCRAYDKDGIVAMSKAMCDPDDIFDFNIGAKLAVDRMYAGYDMTPKPKRKPYNGYVVFVNTKQECNNFVIGTALYKVVDGLINEFIRNTSAEKEDLIIEACMPCSSLTQRIADMYFAGRRPASFDKVLYVKQP